MAIVIDADVIIRGEKEKFDFRGWCADHAAENLEIAAITVAELWHGVERAEGKQRLSRAAYLENILGALPIIPYTEEMAYQHARLWAKLAVAGKMIDYYDMIVAATALERGAAVATFNKKHFGLVPGLKIIEPK